MIRSPVRALISPLCTTLFSYRVGYFVAVSFGLLLMLPGGRLPATWQPAASAG